MKRESEDMFEDGSWEVRIDDPCPPSMTDGWRGKLALISFFFQKIAWTLWGRRIALKKAQEMFLESCRRWQGLAGLDRPPLPNPLWGSTTSIGPQLTEADMCYGDKDPPRSTVEPHHERMERIAAEIASRPRPPKVDDAGLTWALIPLEGEKPRRRRTTGKAKSRGKTRGKSRR